MESPPQGALKEEEHGFPSSRCSSRPASEGSSSHLQLLLAAWTADDSTAFPSVSPNDVSGVETGCAMHGICWLGCVCELVCVYVCVHECESMAHRAKMLARTARGGKDVREGLGHVYTCCGVILCKPAPHSSSLPLSLFHRSRSLCLSLLPSCSLTLHLSLSLSPAKKLNYLECAISIAVLIHC